MFVSRIKTGDTEPIISFALDSLNSKLTGLTNIAIIIFRISDGNYLDWHDMTFKPPAICTERFHMLTEVSATYSPGEYKTELNTSLITNPNPDDAYEITIDQYGGGPAKNYPQEGEIKVGQYIDELLKNEYTVLQSFSYQTGTITGLVWLEFSSLVFPTPTSATLSWYSKNGVLLFTETSSSPDPQGYFKFTKTFPLETNASYYTIAEVVVDGTTVSGGRGVFTIGS